MNEFNNRVQAQRTILREVNSILKLDEELCGLSLKAIERWAHINNMDICGDVVSTLKKLRQNYFFLRTKVKSK